MNRIFLVFVALVVLAAPATSATTFGTGNGEPLPNVTRLSIYRVTGLTDSRKETGGTLVDRGLNETFLVNQSSGQQYRFSFRIVNDGDTAWNINDTDTDVMFHDGLDTDWNVEKIWYNISQDYESGSFSNGRVDWNTSKGGTLDPGETLYAKYLVNISVPSSRTYRQKFKVNETLENAGSYDYHELRVNDLGWLNLTLLEPPSNTVVTQNETFVLNASVECVNGECGEVTVTPRYNQSSDADTVMPRGSGEPFYVNSSREKTCDQDLLSGEECHVSWFVNATGDLRSWHLVDANASSSFDSIENNDTVDSLVQINRALIFDLSWDTTRFGILDPGRTNVSARGNDDLKYNLTVDEDSETIDRLWIRSTALNSTGDNNYSISPRNMSYSNQNDISTETFLSRSFQLVEKNLEPGSLLQFFFWIDMPEGITQDEYQGTIYFKANSTG